MRHAACRRALLDADLNPEVVSHIDECERCQAFSRDLAQVGEYARSLDPGPPPEGLADRVLAGVHAGAEAGAGTEAGGVLDLDREARLETEPGRFRRAPLMAMLSAAAVMFLLVGVLAAVSGGPDGDPQVAAPTDVDPLLTAAGRTLEAGTARVRMSGTASATITPPSSFAAPDVAFSQVPTFEPPPFQAPPPPDYSGFPPDQRAAAEADYQRQVDEMRRQYEAYVAEARAQYEQFASGADEVFAALDIPDEFAFEMAVSGSGSVRYPARMRIDGTMRVVDSEPPLPGDAEMEFGVAVDGARVLVRDGSGWVEIPGAAGPLFPVLADADGVAEMLRAAQGEVRDLGVEELDGFDVRHYRFRVDPGLLAPTGTGGSATADAWIGVEDGLVHKLTLASSVDHRDDSGFRSRMTSSMTIELFDFGADVDPEIPEAAGTSSSGFGPSAMLTPYDAGMPAGFYYGFESGPEPPPFVTVTPAVGGAPAPSPLQP